MSNQEQGLDLAQRVIAHLFVEMGKHYAQQNRESASRDSFAPFLAQWDTEPRLVASALAMSRFPLFRDNVRKMMLDNYNDAYQNSFYGSADAYFDSGDATPKELSHKAEFTEWNAAKDAESREKLCRLDPSLFRELDEWTKSNLNGDTLGGTYGRHCITVRFEDGVLSLAYNPMSEDECGSLAETERKDDIVLFEKGYDRGEWERIAAQDGGMEIEVADIVKSLAQDFSAPLKRGIDAYYGSGPQEEEKTEKAAKPAAPRM